MLNNTTAKNIPILSSLRFFAAFSVIMFHFVCTVTGFINDELTLSLFDNGKNGVQMFFVISGFIIPWSMYYSNYKIQYIFKFLLKRLLRLEPPYIVSIFFAMFVIVMRQKILNNFDVQFSFTQILLHFGYLIPFFEKYNWLNGVYWTLAVEFQYYILISLLFPLFTHSNSIYRYLLYILFLILGLNSNVHFLPHWLPIFLMGIILFLKMINKIKMIEFYSLLLILSIWSLYLNDIGCGIYSLGTVLLILFFNQTSLQIPAFLGEFSFSVYLIHNFTGGTLINVFSHNMVVLWQKILLILSAVIISFLSAWVMYMIIEKPSKKWSAKVKY